MTSPIKLFVATPMYGGMCFSRYVIGIIDLFSFCAAYKIPAIFYGISNCSILSQARNECIYHFLQSDFTHIFFIDPDVGFTGKDALALLNFILIDKEKKYDVLAGSYPAKEICWDKVKNAIEQGVVQDDPNILAHYAATFIPEINITNEKENNPIETEVAHSGFMIIPRKTLEDFKSFYPEREFLTLSKQKWHSFFECMIDPDSKEFLSENTTFCRLLQKMGKKIWVFPFLDLSQHGPYTYEGSLQEELNL